MNTNTQHTPGPWEVETWNRDVEVAYQPIGVKIGGRHLRIADEMNPVWDANARLIAAAPELLEALRELSECRESGKTPPVRMWDAARAAIAKAQGA